MVETRESVTAKLCSFARAFHSNIGKNKIFDDYLAYDLMGRDEYEGIGQLIQNDFDAEKSDKNLAFASDKITKCLNRYITPIPLSRIAFAESELKAFARRHGKCQYVICGAGMDTFAFRNDNPNIKVFELDHPDTGSYKRRRIKELEWNIPDNLTFVPIDFSKDDMSERLLASGYAPELPTFFAILGVSYYLTLSVFEETIRKISSLCSAESKVVFDYPDETTLHGKSTERVHTLAHITEKLGEKMLHGYSYKEVFTVLERHGFEIEEHETPQMIQLRYFKNRSDMAAFENINFILACKGRKEMKTIASFTVNHDKLEKGMYLSRVDGDVVTYDVRMKKPNGGDYLGNGELHTIEHLFATYARNSKVSDDVVYVGPMGCRTGFYLLVRDSVSNERAVRLVRDSLEYISGFEGEIPGSKRAECGNYAEHDLDGAKKTAKDMLNVLKNWKPEDLKYKE